MKKIVSLLFVLLSLSSAADPFSLKHGDISFSFDGESKALLKTPAAEIAIGPLWMLTFHDHPSVNASSFLKAPWNGIVRTSAKGRTAIIAYRSEDLDLDVTITVHDGCLDFQGHILKTAHWSPARLTLPHMADFPLGGMDRVIFPQSGARNNGIAFLPDYFKKHTKNRIYGSKIVGAKGYASLFGDTLNSLADNTPPRPLKVTMEGRNWFSSETIQYIESQELSVSRPPKEGQSDLALVENPDGIALTGSHFGGKGWLFRITSNGNFTSDRGVAVTTRLLNATVEHLVKTNPDNYKGKVVGIVVLEGGPKYGSWTPASVKEWTDSVAQNAALRHHGATVTVLKTPEQMRAALSNPNVVMIVNPYGEHFPNGDPDKLLEDLQLVRSFVRDGGVWWETGGFPFHYVIAPQEYTNYITVYPAAVSDFAQFRYANQSITAFGIQPLMRKPWDEERYVKPCHIEIQGRGDAARFIHGWLMDVRPGSQWTSPIFRWQFNLDTPQAALEEYAKLNDIHVKLEEKVKPEIFDKLKGASLLRLVASPYEKQNAAIDFLPPNNIVHYTEYLKGGFDKQYPDHLPVNPLWGSNDDFAKFIDNIHAKGHLAMPYTNTSWWCTGPKGPTYERVGDSAVLRDRKGEIHREKYAKNEGVAICFFHPEVQKAHRKVRHEMTELFKSDIILQDQFGSRGTCYGYNDFLKDPYANGEGMRSLAMEDAPFVSLACEDGHDRLLNMETMICGASWGLIPALGEYKTRHAKYNYPEGEWQFFPILGYLGHDKCLFTNHDLGHFTGNPEQLASAIAFGYATSDICGPDFQMDRNKMEWLTWLDAVQKSICKDYAGKKLLDFAYLEEHSSRPAPHWLIYAHYEGDIFVVSNTGDQPIPLAGLLDRTALPIDEKQWLEKQTLPPFGFYATSPRIRAARLYDANNNISSCALRLEDEKVRGVYVSSGAINLSIIVPNNWEGKISPQEPIHPSHNDKKLTYSTVFGTSSEASTARQSSFAKQLLNSFVQPPRVCFLRFKAQFNIQKEAELPAVLSQSPKELKTSQPVIAIFNLLPYDNPGFHNRAQSIKSSLAAQLEGTGLSIIEINTFEQLMEALKIADEKARPFAIVNPSSENMLGNDTFKFHDIAKAIKKYVDEGGIWWETGGCPFHYFRNVKQDGSYTVNFLGLGGLAPFGITCPLSGFDDPVESLEVTPEGEKWFGPERTKRINATFSNTARPFEGDSSAITLVRGSETDFISLLRFDGFGFFGNIGGFRFPPELVTDVIGGSLIYLWNNPWPAPKRQIEIVWTIR